MTRVPDFVAALQFQLRAMGLPEGEREARFSDTRKFRFDLAFRRNRLAVEVDGGTWIGGRHTSGSGFERDCEKVSEAAALGWRLLRVTPRMIEDGRALGYLERALRWGEAAA